MKALLMICSKIMYDRFSWNFQLSSGTGTCQTLQKPPSLDSVSCPATFSYVDCFGYCEALPIYLLKIIKGFMDLHHHWVYKGALLYSSFTWWQTWFHRILDQQRGSALWRPNVKAKLSDHWCLFYFLVVCFTMLFFVCFSGTTLRSFLEAVHKNMYILVMGATHACWPFLYIII